MKRLLLLIAVLAILIFIGSQFVPNLGDYLRNQAKNTATNVINKAGEIGNQIQETKESVEQKVEDVRNAVNKVGEAVDAVKKVTGGAETVGSSTVPPSLELR